MSVVERDPATDQFICLACDGIYDVFSNVDLADYINAQMSIKSELDQIATEVVDTSLHKVSYFSAKNSLIGRFWIIGFWINNHAISKINVQCL